MTTWGDMARGLPTQQQQPDKPVLSAEDFEWLIEKAKLGLELDAFNTTEADKGRLIAIIDSVTTA